MRSSVMGCDVSAVQRGGPVVARWLVILVVLTGGCATPGGPPAGGTVAVLTDYGNRDEYVGILKGAMLQVSPAVRIVDTTHEVPAFDIGEADYLLSRLAPEFPEETVFLVVVDPGVGSARRSVAIQTGNGMWFVGPDNGVFTGVVERWGLSQYYEILRPPTGRQRSDTFHGRELFAPTAAYLAMGRDISTFASRSSGKPVMLERAPPEKRDGGIVGQVLHVDHYGNAITNIPQSLVGDVGISLGDRLVLSKQPKEGLLALPPTRHRLPYEKTYSSVPEGELVAVNNSRNLLEFAVNMGSAGEVLGLKAGDVIMVEKQQR